MHGLMYVAMALMFSIGDTLGGVGEAEFRARLAAVTSLLEHGSEEAADRALRLMLEDTRFREEAVRARGEVLETLTRCAFGLSYSPPDVAGLLGAESAAWNRRSGRLVLRFSRACERHEDAPKEVDEDASVYSFHPSGLTLVDGVLLFDVPFTGRCQIAISGKLPEHKKDRKRPPQLVLVVDDGLSYTVDYTWPSTYRKSRGLWSQGTIYEWKLGVSELLATDPTPGSKYDMMWGERYDLKLVVKSGILAASLQGYSMLSVRKARRVYGQLGFRWCPSIEQVSVSGIVERDVIEGLREGHRERAYAAYRNSVDARSLAPAWLKAPDP
jgi:hypothetical protein